MSLYSSLNVSLSGLRNTQTALMITSSNVANAETPGYSRKTHNQATVSNSAITSNVRTLQATRELNMLVLSQWQSTAADIAAAEVTDSFRSRLDTSFGQPGSPVSLDSMFSEVLTGLERLATTPEDYAAQLDVIARMEEFTQQVRNLSGLVQDMRLEAEAAIATAAADTQEQLNQLENINSALTSYGDSDPPPGLLDARDSAINAIAENIDVRAFYDSDGGVSLATESGLSLFSLEAVTLQFDERGAMDASALWDSNPLNSGAGSLVIRGVNGDSTNMFEGNYLRSGRIAALREMRDEVLVEAQAQLDELAAMLALSVSSVTQQGTVASVGAQEGFDLDISGLQSGNHIRLVLDNAGLEQEITIVGVSDASFLPLGPEATANTNDTVIGVDISAGLPAAIASIATELGASFTTSNPSGDVLRVLSNDPNITVKTLNADITRIGLTDEGLGLPIFVDGDANLPFTRSLEGSGQLTGFANRIEINKDLQDDPSRLVVYQTGVNATANGDPLRVNTILERLTGTVFDVAPETGLGTSTRNFAGTVSGYVSQLLAYQGGRASEASQKVETEQVRFNAIEERLSLGGDVNVDEEMSNLIELQNAYTANARVMTVVQELLDELMRLI